VIHFFPAIWIVFHSDFVATLAILNDARSRCLLQVGQNRTEKTAWFRWTDIGYILFWGYNWNRSIQ
jgi:hypothetical protein